jgi:hypothetical protein
MTTATEQTAQPSQTVPGKGIQVTDKALSKVRSAMAKEGISPEEGDCGWVCKVAAVLV